MINKLKQDYFVLTGQQLCVKNYYKYVTQIRLRISLFGRLSCAPGLFGKLFKLFFCQYKKYGIELPFDKIGGGGYF